MTHKEVIMKHATLAAMVFATALFALPALSQSPQTLYCDLRLGATVACAQLGGPVTGVTILPPVVKTDTNCPSSGSWLEAHFDIDLAPVPPSTVARTAYIVVEFQDTPSAWTVDIGDSPTDNGYGGGSDSDKAAEVQVVDQTLSVFDDNTGVYGQVDNLLTQLDSLKDGSLKFVVTDQLLTIGQPWSRLWTPVTKLLFTLPDSNEAACPYCIHAAFNHVIDKSTGRKGCGARSVTISTGP